MFKFSLVLTLIAVQLLAGSGKAVYVCVSSDGSVCCLDAGPESCSCCRQVEDSTSCTDGCCDGSSVVVKPESCCHDDVPSRPHADQRSNTNDSPTLMGGPCNCTHELVSLGQSATVVRSSASARICSGSHQVAELPSISRWRESLEHDARVRWHGPPPRSNCAQTVLSTFVIRC